METLEDIEGLMKAHKNAMGTSLFDHISQVVNSLKNNPNETLGEEPFKNFETISHFISKNQFDYKTPMSEEEVKNKRSTKSSPSSTPAKGKSHLVTPSQQDGQRQAHLPNIPKTLDMLEWAGLGFGKEENYRLAFSLKNLAESSGASNLRFWGKILTRGSDLYVAEGMITKDFKDEIPHEVEARGKEGVNKLTFWVTSDLLKDWTELPLITPKHICQARCVKYMFTGDLEKQVETYPEFEGCEKHLLKAQIVRITYSTVLTPAEQYKADDENERLIVLNEDALNEAQEFPSPNYEAIRNPESWCHLYPNILSTGRVSNYRPRGVGEDDWPEMEEKLNAQEEKTFNTIARLQPIAAEERVYPHNLPKDDDEAQEGQEYKFTSNWLQKGFGDEQVGFFE